MGVSTLCLVLGLVSSTLKIPNLALPDPHDVNLIRKQRIEQYECATACA